MDEKTSIISLMPAFCRAWHFETEQNPLVTDELAKTILTDADYERVYRYVEDGLDFFMPERQKIGFDDRTAVGHIINNHLSAISLCRTAYCESLLKSAVRTGTKQYVILGAELDTFAFRKPPFVKRFDIFEVDTPEMQQDKLFRIRNAGWEIPEKLHFVAADRTMCDLAERLLQAGFDCTKKTFFAWLGGSYYLTEKETNALFAQLDEISAEGSALVMDYADRDLPDSADSRAQNLLALAKLTGRGLQSVYTQEAIEHMLGDCGFLIFERLEPEDMNRRFIRNNASQIEAFPHIRYLQAVKKKYTQRRIIRI